jgi:SpoVK/Ycf46/Vps4 family AAA+-type ATPase
MKLASIILVALMMLFTAATVVNAEDTAAKEAIEKDINVSEHSAEEAKEVVAEAAKTTENDIKATEHVAQEAKEEVTAVSENATVKAEEVKEDVAEAAKSEEKKAPGFEGIFAIAGLLAIAGLVLSRRE